MNELQIFNNSEFGTVRTLEENGNVLFCGNDVATALGYMRPKDAISAHARGAVKCRIPTNGGEQEMSFIPESDLYRLVFSSKLPTAEKFTDWVTTEVLPTIRKTGSYTAKPASAAQMFAMQAQVNLELEQKVQKIAERTEQAEKKITDAVNVFAIPTVSKDNWKQEINHVISQMCEECGLSHQKTRGDMYEELEQMVGCDLTARQNRMRTRIRKNGGTYRDAAAVTKLTVIAQDAKLRAAFEGIVRKWRARQLVG